MTTEVDFHTGHTLPLEFACRLLRKAYRSGARVLVTGPAPQLQTLDRMLWTFTERDFVPHVRLAAAGAEQRARTPIWLADDDNDATAEWRENTPDIVVHLGGEVPGELSGFKRIVEIVGSDEGDAQAARARWSRYKALGFKVMHHAAASAD